MKRGEGGFTAVELMITMIVGAAFLLTGYQLYIVVLHNIAEQQTKTIASNYAYTYMRQYSSEEKSTTSCSAATLYTAALPTSSGLQNATVTVSLSCPYGTSSAAGLVTSTVTYGTSSPQLGVSHAILVSH